MSSPHMLALRLDDVGACAKQYEVYSEHAWGVGRARLSGNWLFLKYLPPFKRWGPYRELTAQEWDAVYDVLRRYHAKLTVAVTAAWVVSERQLIPFPQRFPDEAVVLREGVHEGLIEIANHGLTHCVLKDNAFRPKWMSGNRRYHREFWEWVPSETQETHIARAQEILQGWFGVEVVTFVPPGNVFTPATLQIARRHGLRYLSCHAASLHQEDLILIDEERVLACHDRDVVLHGVQWLSTQLQRFPNQQFCTVQELGNAMTKSCDVSCRLMA